MKKYWYLLPLSAAFALVGLAFCGVFQKEVTVTAITLEPTRVEQTVSCMGVVETADVTAVTLPVDCIISEMYVKVGDRVQQGDVIALVDKEATRQQMFDKESLMVLAALSEEITAPREGTVVEVGAVPGLVEQNSPCVVLSADEDTQIRIAVKETDLRTLKKGMTVHITGDGFDKTTYEGRLSKISSQARGDEKGAVVEGVVTLSEGVFDPSLRLGLTAKATIVTAVTENGYVVPYEAVGTDQNGTYVYVLEGNRVRRQSIIEAARVPQGILLQDASLAQMQIVVDVDSIEDDRARVTVREER